MANPNDMILGWYGFPESTDALGVQIFSRDGKHVEYEVYIGVRSLIREQIRGL